MEKEWENLIRDREIPFAELGVVFVFLLPLS